MICTNTTINNLIQTGIFNIKIQVRQQRVFLTRTLPFHSRHSSVEICVLALEKEPLLSAPKQLSGTVIKLHFL